MVEAGFAWALAFAWRMDKTWPTMRSETPHLRQPPGEYLRQQVWWTTQSMEGPEPRDHLLETIGWMGWDQLLFAPDYPHWDYDDPAHALPLQEDQCRALFLNNACAVCGVAG